MRNSDSSQLQLHESGIEEEAALLELGDDTQGEILINGIRYPCSG